MNSFWISVPEKVCILLLLKDIFFLGKDSAVIILVSQDFKDAGSLFLADADFKNTPTVFIPSSYSAQFFFISCFEQLYYSVLGAVLFVFLVH